MACAQLTRLRIIVDRYALPSDADTTACDPGKQTWCGGLGTRPSSTISPAGAHLSDSIREHLDYIQEAGFTAGTLSLSTAIRVVHLAIVWISPVSQNYDGPTTPYGDAYQVIGSPTPHSSMTSSAPPTT